MKAVFYPVKHGKNWSAANNTSFFAPHCCEWRSKAPNHSAAPQSGTICRLGRTTTSGRTGWAHPPPEQGNSLCHSYSTSGLSAFWPGPVAPES